MKCCPATRRTARRCGRFWAGSKSNTARRGASARQRSTRAISGGNAQGPTEPVGEASDREALAEGEGGRRGQIAGPGRRALCLRPERRSRRQGTRDAAAAVEMAVDRLGKLAAMNVKREEMLMKLGAARSKAPTAWRLVEVALDKESAALTFSLNRQKLRIARRREGRYLLRTNLTDKDPAVLWQYYVQLVAVEEAFKNLKGDLAIRPIFHHDESRIEAHIFLAFLAYALQVTLTRRLRALAPGLPARSALEKFAAVQMIDVHLPTTDGREIVLTRYTQPEPELQLLINQLKLSLPSQPPPKITAAALAQITPRSEDLLV